MGIADVIKKSVLEKFQSTELTTASIVVTLGMAFLLGAFIYLVYRIKTHSGFYNHDFNLSLVILPVITAAIMLAMANSLTISLGMVGALSIVRFRNAIKDSLDLVYLFWSISIGIIVGADLFELALLLSLLIAAALLLSDFLPAFRVPCLLIATAGSIDAEDALLRCAKDHCRSCKVRSRNIESDGAVEWVIELQIRDERELIAAVSALEEVKTVHLMTHEGDVRF